MQKYYSSVFGISLNLALSLFVVAAGVNVRPEHKSIATGWVSITIDTETFNGKTYPRVTLENNIFKAVVRAKSKGDQWGSVEHGIQDFILKANNQDQIDRFLDFSAQRGPLKTATVVYDGADYKRVQLQFDPYTRDPNTTSDDGKPAELYYTIWPDNPVIKVEYIKYPDAWTNTVDAGTPGGTRSGQFKFYGGESWIRGYDMYPKSYWDTYAPDGYNDPANGGSLNYKNQMIMAVANPNNGIGYGRVMPIYAANGNAGMQIIKLLFSSTDRSGFETFPGTGQSYSGLKPFTGYIYLFQNGLDDAINMGKQIADGTMFSGQPTPTSPPATPPSPLETGYPNFQQVVVDSNQFGYRAVGDVDKDGKNDIVATNVNAANDADEETMYVWYQAPGWTKRTIRDLFANPITWNGKAFKYRRTDDMKLADIDRDGDLDVVTRVGLSGSDTEGLVVWLENPLPSGSLSSVWNFHPISGGYSGTNYYAKDIAVEDLDRDGKLDVVTRWHTQVFVWFQDSADAWAVKVTNIPDHEGMDLGDLDGDGDADVVLNGFYLKNPGTWSSPGSARTGTYTKYDIDTKWFSGQTGGQSWQRHNSKVAVGDIDGNGRPDVVISQSELPDYEVAWYSANDAAATSWTKRGNVVNRCNYCHNLQIADFNKDGKMDVLAGGMENTGVSNPDKGLTIYYGDGGSTWTPRVVQSQRSYSAEVGDIGDDGDIDIVGVRNWDSAPIEVWENQGGKLSLNAWAYIMADDSREYWGKWDTPNWLKYFGLGIADVTGDGKQDIVSGRYFYRNPGGNMTGKWPRVDLGLNVDGLVFVNVDGDQFGDIIGTRGGTVYWLEAIDTQGSSWVQRKAVDSSAPFDSSHINPQGYLVADLVPGGRDEVVISNGGKVYYYQIPPTDPVNSTWPRTIAVSNSNGQGVGVGDINRDGYLDLAAAQYVSGGSCTPGNGTGREIKWAANPKSSSGNWTEYIVGRIDGCVPDRIEVADLNKDGRLDIVVSEEEQPVEPNYKTIWFEAPANPTQGNWARHVIVTQYTTNSMDVADMDKDGDKDVILAEHRGDKRLSIFENDGVGGLTRRNVDTGKENHLGARTADLDGDGDLDIVGIAWDAHPYLHIWRNDSGVGGGQPGPTSTPPPTTPAPSPTSPVSPSPTATPGSTSLPTSTPVPPTSTPMPTATPDLSGASSGSNLITNPEFDSGSKAGWSFYTNGTGSFTTVSPGNGGDGYAAKLSISSPGSNVQLRSAPLTLQPNTQYRLQFAARSMPNKKLEVDVDPYPYGLTGKVVNLTENWQTFTFDFTSANSTPITSAQVRFWLAPYDAASDQYFIDSVSLVPNATAAASTATPQLPTVTVTPSSTPTSVLTPTPSAAATSTPQPTLSGASPGTEVLLNGNFESGTKSWSFWINPGGGGQGSLTTSAPAYEGSASGKVIIGAIPSDRNVQVYQLNLKLAPNTKYRLSFAAVANTGHDLWLQLIKSSAPYTNYGLRKTVIDVTTQWKVYTYEFTTANFQSPVSDGRLMFFLGDHARAGDNYSFDRVSLSVVNE